MVDFTDRDAELAEAAPAEPARPKKITFVVVVAIILGMLYLMGFLGTIPGLVMHVVSPGGFNFAPQSDDPQFQMQAEMQAKMAEVTQTYIIPMVLLAFASLGVGCFLLYSSIQCLRRGELYDYRLLSNTTIAAIILVIANAISTVFIQMANWTVMQDIFMMQDAPTPQAAEMFKTIMMISMGIGIAMGVAFQVAQLIYFCLARWILSHYVKTLDTSLPA